MNREKKMNDMKKNLFFVLAAMLLFASCEVKQVERNSTGRVLDVLVAANIKCTDYDTSSFHGLYSFLIGIELFILGRKVSVIHEEEF